MLGGRCCAGDVRYSYSPSFMCCACDVRCSYLPSFLCVLQQRWFSLEASEVSHDQERESALSTQVEAGRVERGVKGGKQEMMEDELMILKRTGGAQSTETGERGEDGLKRAAHPMRKLLGSWRCVLRERCEPHPKKVRQSSKRGNDDWE